MNGEPEPIPPESKRFFVLTPGRSGSAFLGSILAGSGASFFTPRGGLFKGPVKTFENKKLDKISYLLEQAYRIQSEYGYSLGYRLFYKKIVTFKRFTARRMLRHALESGHYYKNTNHLHHGVRLAAHLGYWPVVILDYRNFHTWMGSMYPGQRYRTVASLTEAYTSTMRNTLALLALFGGCAVSYEEIIDPEATAWAHALGGATGLDPRDILANRARLLKAPGPATALPVRDADAEQLEAMAREQQGKVVPPSRVALQYWGPNPTKGPLPKRRLLTL